MFSFRLEEKFECVHFRVYLTPFFFDGRTKNKTNSSESRRKPLFGGAFLGHIDEHSGPVLVGKGSPWWSLVGEKSC